MLSLLQRRACHLRVLGRDAILESRRHQAVKRAAIYEAHHAVIPNVPPHVDIAIRNAQLRWRIRDIEKNGTRAAYVRRLLAKGTKGSLLKAVDVLSAAMIVFEFIIAGLTLSWANLAAPATVTPFMIESLRSGTVIVTAYYFLFLGYRFASPKHFTRTVRPLVEFGLCRYCNRHFVLLPTMTGALLHGHAHTWVSLWMQLTSSHRLTTCDDLLCLVVSVVGVGVVEVDVRIRIGKCCRCRQAANSQAGCAGRFGSLSIFLLALAWSYLSSCGGWTTASGPRPRHSKLAGLSLASTAYFAPYRTTRWCVDRDNSRPLWHASNTTAAFGACKKYHSSHLPPHTCIFNPCPGCSCDSVGRTHTPHTATGQSWVPRCATRLSFGQLKPIAWTS